VVAWEGLREDNRREVRWHLVAKATKCSTAVAAMTLGLLLVGFGSALSSNPSAASGSTSSRPAASRLLFTHRSPDGSSVIARTESIVSSSTCTTMVGSGASYCGSHPKFVGVIVFIYTVDNQHYRTLIFDGDPRITEPGIMNPLFGSDLSRSNHLADLIILHVRSAVAEVRLAPSGPRGASPLGDRMVPVNGWAAFPIHNFTNLHDPTALNSKGKVLGTSLPFPCC